MLSQLDLKSSYTSEEDNIYQDFFVPVLKNAIEYKRAVGFFSLGVLLNAPSAMSQIVENEGKIKLIFSQLVSNEDFKAIKEGSRYSWPEVELPDFSDLIDNNPDGLLEYRIRLLAYLFSTDKLEMKIAFRPNGMFHQKIGIVSDRIGNQVSFNGSMNETMAALDPEYNSEEITTFKSWIEGQKTYVEKHSSDFDKLWANNTNSKTLVSDLPNVLAEGLRIVSERFTGIPKTSEEASKLKEFFEKNRKKTNRPTIPSSINGNKFSIRDHQVSALQKWEEAKFNGILELATGTGKTITSIFAAVKLSEKIEGFCLVTVVPYLNLADQWCEELALFNIYAVKCYGPKSSWSDQLIEYFKRNRFQQREFLAIVVVNKTFKSEHFQENLNQLDLKKTMIIGDECHHHGGESFQGKLPINAGYKIGLSATPFHYIDQEGNERLREFYGNVVYKYTLYDAIKNGILTPYEYIPIPIVLTAEENEEFNEISDKMAQAYASSKGVKNDSKNVRLDALISARSRLIGTAINKLVHLSELIDKQPIPSHSLFYCSDGRVREDLEDNIENIELNNQHDDEVKQRIAVAKLLRSKNVSSSPFTADETNYQRKEILRMFKEKEVNSLIAIRCLDEGIDVPAISTAYLLASSRNPRQFIQRRGRILRKAPGKDKARIYDFVVMLQPNHLRDDKRERDFFKAELTRVAEFAKHSLNPLKSVKPLKPWLEMYELQHLIV